MNRKIIPPAPRIPLAPPVPSELRSLDQLQECISSPEKFEAAESTKDDIVVNKARVLVREAQEDVHSKVSLIRRCIQMHVAFQKRTLDIFFTPSMDRAQTNQLNDGIQSFVYSDHSVVDLVRSKLHTDGYPSSMISGSHQCQGDILLKFDLAFEH